MLRRSVALFPDGYECQRTRIVTSRRRGGEMEQFVVRVGYIQERRWQKFRRTRIDFYKHGEAIWRLAGMCVPKGR